MSRESLASGAGTSILNKKPHILHLLPQPTRSFNSFARSKLVQSLESFLLSYAYPPSVSLTKPVASVDDILERARPYILQAATLGEFMNPEFAEDVIPSSDCDIAECTVADLILCGALDPPDAPATAAWQTKSSKGKQKGMMDRGIPPRAWISGPADFVFLSDQPSFFPYVPPSAQSPVIAPGTVVTPPQEPQSAAKSSSPTRVVPRQGQQHLDHLESFSSSVSTPGMASPLSTSPAASPIPLPPPASLSYSSPIIGSPLAREASANKSLGRFTGYGGLPTPPDSDESGSELTTSIPGSGHASISPSPIPSQDLQRMRTESYPGYSSSHDIYARSVKSGNSVGETPDRGGSGVADGASAKKKWSKWKFWKSSNSSRVKIV